MMRFLFIFIFVCLLQLTGCSGFWAGDEARFDQKAIELRRLGSAVQGELWRGALPDADLLELACARDPDLCEPFKAESMLVFVEGHHVALMLCDRERKYAIIEDTPCTPETDRRAWEEKKSPCTFTLDIETLCTR